MYRIKPPDHVNDRTKKRRPSVVDIIQGAALVVLVAMFLIFFIMIA